jgi:hypothetical protein
MANYGNKALKAYSREDIKQWIKFGIENGYINQYKKDQVLRWVQLLLKNGFVFIR